MSFYYNYALGDFDSSASTNSMLKHLLEQRTIGNREFLPLSGQALLGFRLLPGPVRCKEFMSCGLLLYNSVKVLFELFTNFEDVSTRCSSHHHLVEMSANEFPTFKLYKEDLGLIQVDL